MSLKAQALTVNEIFGEVTTDDVYLVSKAYIEQRDAREIYLLQKIEELKQNGKT